MIISTLIKFWWILPVFLYNIGYAWISIQNSNENSDSWKWFWIAWVFSSIQLWNIISKFTSNNEMILTAIIYDVIILVGFQIGLIIFGCAKDFNMFNWIGLIIVMLGLIIFKIGG